ncbi:MAG: hypothetical protein ABIN67_16180 [Ferruginibacter sp.]
MSNSKIFKLIDLIEDVKKVDKMIALHQKAENSNFMLTQYQAKKIKLTGYLITELNSPPFKSATSFLFIKHFLDKFFVDSLSSLDSNDKELSDFSKLEAAL